MTAEDALLPYAATPLPAVGDALVLAPHADDEVLGCAGAICAHLSHGYAVDVVIVTDGAEQAEHLQIRRDEACAAAAVLGYGAPEFWDLPDRGLAYGEALVERLRTRIEASAARAVYAPSPWEVHPDHLALSLAATEAVRRLGGERTLVLYEVGAPLQPNRLLDLGPYLDAKHRAMACFASQLGVQRYDRHIEGLNRFRAYTLGREVEAAEAFHVVAAQALGDGGLRALHSSPAARRLAQGAPIDAAEQPLVSIICRTMGRPEFADAAASVAVQTYPSIEFIVVDAAARGLVLDPWCGRFPQRVVGTGEPLPRGAAASLGLEAARGEFCLFLDEDDWIDPDHVAKLVPALRRNRQAPAAFTSVAVVDPNGEPTGRVFDGPFNLFGLLTENTLPIHSVLFRRDCLSAGCTMDPALGQQEDWDFWLQLAGLGDFIAVPGVSAYYRQGGGSDFGAAADAPPTAELADRIRRHSIIVMQRALQRTPPERLYQVMYQARERVQRTEALTRARDEADTELSRLRCELSALRRRGDELEADLAEGMRKQQFLEERSALLDRVLASTPWRLTAPYRWLVHQANRVGIGLKPGGMSDGQQTAGLAPARELPSAARPATDKEPYQAWRETNAWSAAHEQDLQRRLRNAQGRLPKLSVVMPVYRPNLRHLQAAVASVQAQVHEDWELCIADDGTPGRKTWRTIKRLAAAEPRIRFERRACNGNISLATNSAAALAEGEFLVFLDQDDLLTPDALAEAALYLAAHPETDYLYSDDDKIDAGGKRHYAPQFKPDWSPELLLSYMYCSHLVVVRRAFFEALGGCRSGFDGSQDYDLALRATEQARHVGHSPRVLYHWRAAPGSVASSGDAKANAIEAGRRAAAEALSRRGIVADCLQSDWARTARVGIYQPEFPDTGPRVAIIIPTADRPDLLRPCLESLQRTSYREYEILIVDNGVDFGPSRQTETGALAAAFGCRVLRQPEKPPEAFNFSRLINRAAAHTDADYLLLLNDDTTVIERRWLSQMMGYARISGVGAVGAKLLYPDGSIQHAGVVHGVWHGMAAHAFAGSAHSEGGYLAYKAVARNTAAVTAACMLTPRAAFDAVGGFDEARFPVAYSDVDYCWRLADRGLRSVYCPDALLTHHESATRARRDPPEHTAAYRRVHGHRTDPYYSPHLSTDEPQYRIRPRRLPPPDGPARPARVLFGSHLLDRTGAALHLLELAVHLKRRGGLSPVVLAGCDGPLQQDYAEAGIEVHIDPTPFAGHLRQVPDPQPAIDQAAQWIAEQRIDAVFANTLDGFALVTAARAAGVASIWNIHESEPLEDYLADLPEPAAACLVQSFQSPYRVVFVAEATRAGYARWETSCNFTTIPNALDPAWLQAAGPLERPSTCTEPGGERDILILLLGTVCERKGQTDLLRALERLPISLWQRLRCRIVGDRTAFGPDVPNAYSAELHRLHAMLPDALRQRTEIIPETADALRHYRAADICVCTSRIESAPRVILEAMATGLPIITTPVFGIREQVQEGANAFFYDPGDIDGLTHCLRQLLCDGALRARMAAASPQVAEALPSHADMIDAYEQCLLEAAWPPPPGSVASDFTQQAGPDMTR